MARNEALVGDYASASLSLAALSLSSWPHTANARRGGSRERDLLRANGMRWPPWPCSTGVGVFTLSVSRSRSRGMRTRVLWCAERGLWMSSRSPLSPLRYSSADAATEDEDEDAEMYDDEETGSEDTSVTDEEGDEALEGDLEDETGESEGGWHDVDEEGDLVENEDEHDVEEDDDDDEEPKRKRKRAEGGGAKGGFAKEFELRCVLVQASSGWQA